MDKPNAATIKQSAVLADLAEALRKELGDNLKRIVLFGSRARGDFEEWSDYDVMVLVGRATPGLKERVFGLKSELDWKHNVLTSVFLEEQSYFDQKKYEPLFINIRKEGVTI